jgi:hypothetical protein
LGAGRSILRESAELNVARCAQVWEAVGGITGQVTVPEQGTCLGTPALAPKQFLVSEHLYYIRSCRAAVKYAHVAHNLLSIKNEWPADGFIGIKGNERNLKSKLEDVNKGKGTSQQISGS